MTWRGPSGPCPECRLDAEFVPRGDEAAEVVAEKPRQRLVGGRVLFRWSLCSAGAPLFRRPTCPAVGPFLLAHLSGSAPFSGVPTVPRPATPLYVEDTTRQCWRGGGFRS